MPQERCNNFKFFMLMRQELKTRLNILAKLAAEAYEDVPKSSCACV
jgi:hypothetical protein